MRSDTDGSSSLAPGGGWIAGRATPGDVPVGKLVYSELNLAMAEFALTLLGADALLVEGDPEAADDGAWQDEYLYARTYTIAGGSSEIMRNIIGERALGLPKEQPKEPNRS